MPRRRVRWVATSCLVLALAACGADPASDGPARAPTERPVHTSTTPSTPSTPSTTGTTRTTTPEPEPVVIELRLQRRATTGTDGFEELVRETLTDPRGWTRAGFEFRFSDDAPYRVMVAEPAEVDAVCAPYDTGGRWSCQNGPTVALNADRWRQATDTWPASLDEYRRMLVNHEVGHLIGRHHARPACDRGGPAAVMFQQSSGVEGCEPNPWPLPWEIECAARHDEPIAPGYEPDAEATCGPADV